MSMRVVSVNVGMPREIAWKGMAVETGIFKEPVAGAVKIGKLNLEGDKQADLTVHGGAEKAVYAYPAEHYGYWRLELPSVEFHWGKFGENLTTEGMDESNVNIGDVVRAGSALLVVTQPRLPCYKLTIRFERDDMIKRFLVSGRTGFYFSVKEPGELSAGAAIDFESRDPNRVSVADVAGLYLGKTRDQELLRRALALTALPENWKAELAFRAQTTSA